MFALGTSANLPEASTSGTGEIFRNVPVWTQPEVKKWLLLCRRRNSTLMVFAKDVNAPVLSAKIEVSESFLQRLHTLYESLSFCVSVFASLASLKPRRSNDRRLL